MSWRKERDRRAEVLPWESEGSHTGTTEESLGYLDFWLWHSRCSRAHCAVNLTLQDAP